MREGVEDVEGLKGELGDHDSVELGPDELVASEEEEAGLAGKGKGKRGEGKRGSNSGVMKVLDWFLTAAATARARPRGMRLSQMRCLTDPKGSSQERPCRMHQTGGARTTTHRLKARWMDRRTHHGAGFHLDHREVFLGRLHHSVHVLLLLLQLLFISCR